MSKSTPTERPPQAVLIAERAEIRAPSSEAGNASCVRSDGELVPAALWRA